MAEKLSDAKNQYKSTQSYLTISEIKHDTMIMESGKYIAVIAISSINFALKSADEQNALIQGYQNFLNSLDYEIQILMQSRKMDIHIYLAEVQKKMETQTNELLRVQTQEYIEFISKLVENASIMNKSFYILVSHFPGMIDMKGKQAGFFSGLFGKTSEIDKVAAKNAKFDVEKHKLDQKVTSVISGLSGLGLRAVQMGTEEITELLYNSYNFGSAPVIDMSKINDLQLTQKEA
jgi:hypothetical protein